MRNRKHEANKTLVVQCIDIIQVSEEMQDTERLTKVSNDIELL